MVSADNGDTNRAGMEAEGLHQPGSVPCQAAQHHLHKVPYGDTNSGMGTRLKNSTFLMTYCGRMVLAPTTPGDVWQGAH